MDPQRSEGGAWREPEASNTGFAAYALGTPLLLQRAETQPAGSYHLQHPGQQNQPPPHYMDRFFGLGETPPPTPSVEDSESQMRVSSPPL